MLESARKPLDPFEEVRCSCFILVGMSLRVSVASRCQCCGIYLIDRGGALHSVCMIQEENSK